MDVLICSICLESFDIENRQPLVLTCGHTFCKLCLGSFVDKAFLCPMDRQQEWRDIASLPKNYLILDLIGKPIIVNRCKTHNEKLKWKCNTDSSELCSECILDHISHDLEKIHFAPQQPHPVIDRNPQPLVQRISQSTLFPPGSFGDINKIILPSKSRAENSKLLYSFQLNGASNATFHRLCDGKGPTVVVVKLENGRVFGGFTSRSWGRNVNSRGNNVRDDKAYLFSISDRANSCRLNVRTEYRSMAVYHHIDCGPTFGVGYDLYINLDSLPESCSRLEAFSSSEIRNKDSFLAGKFNNWQFHDLEVYLIL